MGAPAGPVEAQASLARGAIGAVALEAVVGEDGADFPLEIDGRRGLRQQNVRRTERHGSGRDPVIDQVTLLRTVLLQYIGSD